MAKRVFTEEPTGDAPARVADKDLKALLPKGVKLPKTAAARADLLYEMDQLLSAQKKALEPLEQLTVLLRRWFIEELPMDEATGVSGKIGVVQIKLKERPAVEDWDKFYAHIHKKKAWDLLGRSVPAKAVQERWDAGQVIPGLGKYRYKSVSVTKLKTK